MKQGPFHNGGLQKWDGVEKLPNDIPGPFAGRMGRSGSGPPDRPPVHEERGGQPCATHFAKPLHSKGIVLDLTLEEAEGNHDEAPPASSTDVPGRVRRSFESGGRVQALRTCLDLTVESPACPPPCAQVSTRRPRWRHLAPMTTALDPFRWDDVAIEDIEVEALLANLWEEMVGVDLVSEDSDS